jgi:23S rRNA pseudouridine1911/1915/1917 synthase
MFASDEPTATGHISCPSRVTLQVEKQYAGSRLDRFLALALPTFSRARLQTLIRDGFVKLNGKIPRPRDLVRSGDTVELTEPELEKVEAQPEDIPLQILFEDDDLLVVNKPAGLVVHPGAGHQQHTLVNALLAHCQNLSGIGGKERPGIVHRLDKETSGCLVVAKNDATHRDLSRQFAARTMQKIYLTLVAGVPRKSTGVIDLAIARHPVHRQRMSIARRQGRSAKTEYRVLRSSGEISLVECTLHSGRTHQIRVHLHHLGHPVLGDKLYGGKRAGDYPRQMLHAWKLGFTHPRTTQVMPFEAPLPPDFEDAMRSIPDNGARGRMS